MRTSCPRSVWGEVQNVYARPKLSNEKNTQLPSCPSCLPPLFGSEQCLPLQFDAVIGPCAKKM